MKSKSPRSRISRRKPSTHYIVIASELEEFHPIFEKYSKRKILKPWEKGLITRHQNRLHDAINEIGANNITLAKKQDITSLRKSGLLDKHFNIFRLNTHSDNEYKITRSGVIEQPSTNKETGAKRIWHYCPIKFSSKRELGDEDYQEIIIDKFEAEISAIRKLIKGKHVRAYLWGKTGVFYKAGSVSDIGDLTTLLEIFMEKYPDRAANIIHGIAWHTNGDHKRRKPKKKAKKHGKN